MTREEHLAWAKQRALEYVNAGDLINAVASMGSDMSKHESTAIHPALVGVGMLYAADGKSEDVRHWIEGFR